jgi:hypothetical protein
MVMHMQSTLPPPTTTQPTGGGQTRITVSMLARALAAIDDVHDITGETRTDCINRAVQLYAMAHRAQADGGCLYIRETPDGELTRMRVL